MNKSKSKTWDSKLFRRILGISKPHITLLIYGIVLTILLAFLSPLRPYIIGKLVGEYVRLSSKDAMVRALLLWMNLHQLEFFTLNKLKECKSSISTSIKSLQL